MKAIGQIGNEKRHGKVMLVLVVTIITKYAYSLKLFDVENVTLCDDIFKVVAIVFEVS